MTRGSSVEVVRPRGRRGAEDVGPVEGVVERAPAGVGCVQRVPGVGDRYDELRCGDHCDLRVEARGADGEGRARGHEVADVGEHRAVLLGLRRAGVIEVPPVDRRLHVGAGLQQRLVAGSELRDQVRQPVPERACVDSRSRQRLPVDEVGEVGVDGQPGTGDPWVTGDRVLCSHVGSLVGRRPATTRSDTGELNVASRSSVEPRGGGGGSDITLDGVIRLHPVVRTLRSTDALRGRPARVVGAAGLDLSLEDDMYYDDQALFPENMQPLIITAAPYGPTWLPGDAEDIADHLGRAGPGGGGLLQRRRHHAALPRARPRDRAPLGGHRPLQLPARTRQGSRARDDHPGRRLDRVLAQERWREGRMAGLRHAAHAGGAGSEAGDRHDRHRHLHVRHHADVDRGRCQRNAPGGSEGDRRLCRHVHRRRSGLLPRTPQAPDERLASSPSSRWRTFTSSRSSSG